LISEFALTRQIANRRFYFSRPPVSTARTDCWCTFGALCIADEVNWHNSEQLKLLKTK
jgi:hypothetical protein